MDVCVIPRLRADNITAGSESGECGGGYCGLDDGDIKTCLLAGRPESRQSEKCSEVAEVPPETRACWLYYRTYLSTLHLRGGKPQEGVAAKGKIAWQLRVLVMLLP